jgi:hypothetical protein
MLVPPPGSDREGAGAVFEGEGVVVDGARALSALEPVVVVLALLPSV